jgi:hypothetical protein
MPARPAPHKRVSTGSGSTGSSTSERSSRCGYIKRVIVCRMWAVLWHPEAEEELMQLPRDDRRGDTFVIAAVAPEAQVDRRGFDRAVRIARRRLEE